MATAFYARVSSEEQAERGTIATQISAADSYRSLHQLGEFTAYLDEGVSGTLPLEERPQGRRLLEDARAGRIDAVVVYKLDRFGREPRHILNAVGELDALNVPVRSMTEPLDTTTPAGRFLLTILSGVAGLERDTLLERSKAGTNRLAREGAWLGGIVPYGYRVEGKRNEARLTVADEPMPGVGLSEADVVRLLYQMAGDEGRSTIAIAASLNALGIPTRYVLDGREVERGKRKQATANHWSPGRVRNMLVSSTYKGLHQYGKRAKRQREVIERPVPPIVSVDLWERAQQTLRKNFIWAKRNAKRVYLLRGLLKCAHCGLTYIGTQNKSGGGERVTWYKCNGKHQRGKALPGGQTCESKSIPAHVVESAIWDDVERFLRYPGEVLDQLRTELQEGKSRADELGAEILRLEKALAAKEGERDTVLTLYRRGRIDAVSLDRQLDAIHAEESAVRGRVEELQARFRLAEETSEQFTSAESLLRRLNERLDHPLDVDARRQLIRTLVERITVETVEENGRRVVNVVARYRFAAAIETCTGTDSWRRPA